MITLAEAQHIAAGWAHRESIRRGYPCTPWVDELTLGYAVGMSLPPEARPEPGEDVTTVIDRETGRLSYWPPAPPAELDRLYTQRRDAAVGSHRTADPIAELRRESHRRVSPSVAAHLTLGGRLFRARGAKGDQNLRHHPLVARLLGAIPAANTIRGAERHAELLVVSDVLFEADKTRAAADQAPFTADEARALLAQGQFETFHIRESGDRIAGRPAPACGTCAEVLVAFGIIDESDREYRFNQVVRRKTSGDDPEPGRFPPEVAWELAAYGWEPGTAQKRATMGETAAGYNEDTRGTEHALTLFPAARAAYREFHGVGTNRNCPGIAQRARWFEIGTGPIRNLADPLHEFGALIGARMFPLGTEGLDEAVLAIDEHGRVFALDQGGEWFLGDDLDEAIIALTMGLPAARVRDDGSWRTQS